MALNFNNTEVAFKYLTDKELKRLYYVFKILNNNTLSNIGKSLTLQAFNIGLPIKTLVKNTIFEAFVGGENVEESLPEINTLNEYKVGVILDYGVEAKNTESEFDEVAMTIENLVLEINASQRKNIQICAKISAFARNELLERKSAINHKLNNQEKAEWDRVLQRMDKLAQTANKHDVKLYIDAEESWLQPAIDELVEQLMKKFNKVKPVVFHTVQLYRTDRLDYLKKTHELAEKENFIFAVKLVRGAYMEKERERALQMHYESPIQLSKSDTDKSFNQAVEYCIQHIDDICMCLASHNEESNYYLAELLEYHELSPNHPHVIVAQLFGMGDYITFNLAEDNYNAYKYLPFGPVEDLLPYLLRRAQENSSVDGQASRELSLIKKEIKRRGLKTII